MTYAFSQWYSLVLEQKIEANDLQSYHPANSETKYFLCFTFLSFRIKTAGFMKFLDLNVCSMQGKKLKWSSKKQIQLNQYHTLLKAE